MEYRNLTQEKKAKSEAIRFSALAACKNLKEEKTGRKNSETEAAVVITTEVIGLFQIKHT